MDKQLFSAWSELVKAKVYRDIQREMYISGSFPEAIIAGGEYQFAFIEDTREIQHTVDGGYLWRGVPLIMCGAVNGVKVIWHMEDIDLPEPPKGE